MSNEDVVIKRMDVGKWYAQADCGMWCPVSVKLANNGWRLIHDKNVNSGKFTIVVRIRRIEYEVTTDSSGRVDIYRMDDASDLVHVIGELRIPRGHPAIKFFQMTGVGKDMVERTVCIDYTLNPQIY